MYDSWQGLGNVCHQEAGFSAFLVWAPGTRWCDQAKHKEFQDWLWSPPWAQWGVLSAGCVQEWLPPALISFTLSFHDQEYPPGISTDYQWFLHTEWERKALHLHTSPGTTLIPFPQCIGGWEMYPDKPRIFLISFSFRVTGNTSHRVFCF